LQHLLRTGGEEATEPSAGALKAVAHAQKLHDQRSPAIWFDDWGHDQRDNNLNGQIDEDAEKVKDGKEVEDGDHYKKKYPKGFPAKVCKNASDTTASCPTADQSTIQVDYKVCIDIPIESYNAAGLKIPSSRWIPTFFGSLRSNKNWTVWKAPAQPKHFLAGDIVAAANAKHQHAGIVERGFLGVPIVINLPGPSASRKYGVFKPSGLNDLVSVPKVLFESFLGIDWIARPKN
jgi:hypothetical protein